MQLHVLFLIASFSALLAPLGAAEDAFAAVRSADAARVKATTTGDGTRLGELLSDDLIYGNNDGRAQTKTELVKAVASHQVKYEAFDYEETKLLETAPGIVTMTGRVHLKVNRSTTHVEFWLRFLAVWRLEDGRWRLHAYQSARLPEIVTMSAPKPSA